MMGTMKAALPVLLALLVPNAASAQPLSFETASVKRAPGDDGVRGGCHGIDSKYAANQDYVPSLGRCVITNARLSHFVMIGWGMATTDRIVIRGPDWIARGNDRYNIEAQAADREHATEAQLLEMLQNLLVERFQLKFHREAAEKPGFALVIGKSGSKLRASTAPALFSASTHGNPAVARPDFFLERRCSMDRLADILARQAHRPVVNETGLPGEYDLSLTWSDAIGPSLDDALQDQLGLHLAPQDVSISLFVVDSAERPDTN
jgi:uncharacterized protein (TIGR03435 family)